MFLAKEYARAGGGGVRGVKNKPMFVALALSPWGIIFQALPMGLGAPQGEAHGPAGLCTRPLSSSSSQTRLAETCT